MNILIISERWGSDAGIGAIRPMKIAKYLLHNNHTVTVFYGTDVSKTRNIDTELQYLHMHNNYSEYKVFEKSNLFKKIYEIILRRNKKFDNDIVKNFNTNSPVKPTQKIIKILKQYMYRIIYMRIEVANIVKNAIRIINKINIKPDIIFSTYGPLESAQLGKKLKQKYSKSIWIADFRDPIPWYSDFPIIRKSNEKLQMNICKKSNIVTVVSYGLKQEFDSLNIKNVNVLYNGFDMDDKIITTPSNENDKMIFSYTGNLYEDKSDLTPFVKAINELINENLIDSKKICIKYAGNHDYLFDNQFNSLKEKVVLEISKKVPRIEALKIQQNSDILLHATWNSKNNIGVLTGKLYEYLMSKKPVISIISGDLENSEVSVILKKSNVGFVHEIVSNNNLKELKEFIKFQYDKKMQTKNTYYNPNNEFISQFDYKNIVQNMIKMIDINKK